MNLIVYVNSKAARNPLRSNQRGHGIIEGLLLLAGIGVFAFVMISSSTFQSIMSDTKTGDNQALLSVPTLDLDVTDVSVSGKIGWKTSPPTVLSDVLAAANAMIAQNGYSSPGSYCFSLFDARYFPNCATASSIFVDFETTAGGIDCLGFGVNGFCQVKAEDLLQNSGECQLFLGCSFSVDDPGDVIMFTVQ